MKIFLRFTGGSSTKFRRAQEELEVEPGTTVRQVIKLLDGPAVEGPGEKLPVAVIVNGRSIYTLDGPETVVKDGDTVVFVPYLAGG
ncbi:MoaD/ThiS family protein [Neomoorella thermoacetica]|uniref:MoaD/ThiS family protein n=1 Tax=Neomoorella thermoacetica TaxID=1525 RepID=UPI001653171E|nr:MoaD/ThiS family protein [Moorella thermoacetica]